ncbi:MAG: recombinase family protein [Muricomes sp.]
MSEKILRCAIYIRVSTTEQMIHGKSLEAQKEYLTSYAKNHNMVVAGIYSDEGKTARKELKKRKAIHTLLQDVQRDKIDIILFWRIDRWFRNLSDFYKVQDVLDAHGVRWISASEPGINMETRDGRLQLNVVLSIGQNEVDTTSERIKFVNEASIRQGKVIFGDSNMPRGYKVGLVDGVKKMVKNPDEEQMVNDFYRYLKTTHSKSETLRYIQKNHDPNFSYSMMRTMLESEFYIGTYRGIPYCPAYLTREERDEILQISKKNVKKTPSGRIYYFSSLIHCPVCNQLLCGTGVSSIINHKTGAKKSYTYYRCNRTYIDHICTHRRRVSQNLIESYLIENLEQLFYDFKIRNSNVKMNTKKNTDLRDPEKIKREMKRLNLLFQKERIEWEYYNREYSNLEKELEEMSVVQKVPQQDYSYVENLLQSNFREIYSKLTPENKRSFWQSTLNQIFLTANSQISKVDFL